MLTSLKFFCIIKKSVDRTAQSKHAPLAQLVEQLTLNQWVLGSSPRWRTILFFGYKTLQLQGFNFLRLSRKQQIIKETIYKLFIKL